MRKFSSLLVIVCTIAALCIPSMAATGSTPDVSAPLYVAIREPERVIAEQGPYRFIKIDEVPEATSSDSLMEPSICSEQIMPLENSVTRFTPMGVLVLPIVMYNGEPTAMDGDGIEFFSPAIENYGYIAGTMPLATQESIKNNVRKAGFEPIGWYMITGYTIDSYKPIRWQYYELTGTGKSAQKGKTATNGDNTFELISYYSNETSPYYTFGITGTLTYQQWHNYPTSTVPIQLTVSFRDN